MSEDVNNDVEQEIVTPSAEETRVESPSQEPIVGSKEYNMREMRRLLEQQQREIRELRAASQRIQSEEEEDEEDSVGEDDFLTRKQAEKLASRKAQELIKQQEIATLEDRTRLKFKDYDEVVSEENVKKLIEDDGDLADSLRGAANPYATAYKLIKKSAFYSEKVKEKPRSQEAEKIIKNAQKPVSANAVQSRPLAQASAYMNLSEQEKVALYREMMDYAGRK